MNKLITLIILASLTIHGVSCGLSKLFHSLKAPNKGQKTETGFDSLNKYLLESLAGTEDTEANLAHVRANIDNFDGPMRRAAELLLKVPDIKNGCDQEYMDIVQEIHGTGVYPFGQKRIEKLIRKAGLEESLDVCMNYLKSFVDSLTDIHFKGERVFNKPSGYSSIIHMVSKLSQRDPEAEFEYEQYNVATNKLKTVEDEQKYMSALNTYLLEPCRQMISDRRLSHLIDGHDTLKRLGAKSWLEEKYHVDLHNLMVKKRVCTEVLKMDPVKGRNEPI